MLNFVEKIDPVEFSFPQVIRSGPGNTLYFFNNERVSSFAFRNGQLQKLISFEQSIENGLGEVHFLNQTLFLEPRKLLIVNTNKSKDVLLASLYDPLTGELISKRSIKKRHAFTQCKVLANDTLLVHDHQNYVELYRPCLDGLGLLEKSYKISLKTDFPLIVLGAALEAGLLYIMVAQSDRLLVHFKEFKNALKSTEPVIKEVQQTQPLPAIDLLTQPNNLNAKQIERLTSLPVLLDMQLPKSFVFNFVVRDKILYFSTRDTLFRLKEGQTPGPDIFPLKGVLKLEPEIDGSLTVLCSNGLTSLGPDGLTPLKYSKAIEDWRDWGFCEKKELMDLQRLAADTYLILSPHDCFLVQNNRFVLGIEFFPVILHSFRV